MSGCRIYELTSDCPVYVLDSVCAVNPAFVTIDEEVSYLTDRDGNYILTQSGDRIVIR